ncbi:16624_t:CDS:2, partial [Entrophospora sp. SA101]
TCLKKGTYKTIANTAAIYWKNMKKSENSCLLLLEQLKKYKLKQSPYNEPYVLKHSNPLRWWYVCEEDDGVSDYLQELASKLFSITPHSVSCERVFSVIGWFYGNRRTRLSIKKIEDMAKIYFYHKSNIKKELQYFEDVTHQELKMILENSEFDNLFFEESEQVFNCSNENNNRKRVGDIKNRQNNKTKKSKRSKIINICESDDEYQDGLMESERIDNRICKKGTKEKNSSKDMEDDEKDNSEEENSEEENNEEENSEKDNSEEENMEDEDKESEDDNEKSDDESEKSDDKINKSAATKKFKLRNRQDISYKV